MDHDRQGTIIISTSISITIAVSDEGNCLAKKKKILPV